MRILRNPKFEVAEVIVNKATEQMRVKAQAKARDFLCHDCYDQRCRNDGFCLSFFTVTEDLTMELIAIAVELN